MSRTWSDAACLWWISKLSAPYGLTALLLMSRRSKLLPTRPVLIYSIDLGISYLSLATNMSLMLRSYFENILPLYFSFWRVFCRILSRIIKNMSYLLFWWKWLIHSDPCMKKVLELVNVRLSLSVFSLKGQWCE